MAGLQRVLDQPLYYSRDIFPTLKLKPMTKVTITPLAMMKMTILTYFLIWMVMEQMLVSILPLSSAEDPVLS